jgi:hypothetical protein
MQASTEQHWTWNQFLGWAFGDERLTEIAHAIHDAALRARYLCDVPTDATVRAELTRNLAGIARHAERLQLDPEAALARRTLRFLHGAAPNLADVSEGCDALERIVTEQQAHEAALT